MRCLNRNKVSIYYALYQGKEDVVDDDGFYTGETVTIYSEPKKLKANVSSAKGESITQQFGEQLQYDKTIVLDDAKFPIDEYSILWIDTTPDKPHDYVVKKVARSINSVSYAISKVNANDEN